MLIWLTSIEKELCAEDTLSTDEIRAKIRSTNPIFAELAGTKEPIWAIKTSNPAKGGVRVIHAR